MAFSTKIPMKTDLDTPLKAKKQYWSIEWTLPDSNKENSFVENTHRGPQGGVLGLICLKNSVFDKNTDKNRPKYPFKR